MSEPRLVPSGERVPLRLSIVCQECNGMGSTLAEVNLEELCRRCMGTGQGFLTLQLDRFDLQQLAAMLLDAYGSMA